MPVRSLNSSVLKWPGHQEVDEALRRWARALADTDPQVVRVGYFGSYARGDWGVGSDLDVLAIVRESAAPFQRRAAAFDTLSLPVPAELLVYTEREWGNLLARQDRFARTLATETVWVD